MTAKTETTPKLRFRLPDGTPCDFKAWLLTQLYVVQDGPLICDDEDAPHA